MAWGDGPGVNEQVENLARRFEKDGVDARYLEEPFLEASELGDAAPLRRRLAELSPDERRRFVRAVDQQGRSGLLLAVRKKDAEVARVLLDSGANPNDADSGGVTALHLAGGAGACPIIELLLECRADAQKQDDQGETPLMWAGSRAAAEALLKGGAAASTKSSSGRTALMLACSRGAALDLVQCLAELPGADLNELDANGQTAHGLALASDSADLAAELLRLGASASEPLAAKRRVATTDEALHEAVRHGDATHCAALAEAPGVDVNRRIAGETPLLVAAGLGAGRIMEVLLEAKADPNLVDPFLQESPLLRAVLSHCSLEVLWMLLEAGADPSLCDLSGRTPAAVAKAWGSVDAMEILTAAADGELDVNGMD